MAEATTTTKSATTPSTPVPKPARKAKAKRTVTAGRVHIKATFNNTLITITDTKGGVLTWASAGTAGFKGSRKSTAYAAQLASQKAAASAKNYGLKKVEVLVRGIGQGREAAIRALQNTDLFVTSIKDVTGLPHNGARPRRPRRV